MNLAIKGLNINYTTTKISDQNETILFLHGFSGGIFSFKGLQNNLAKKFNTINLDLPSFGLSDDAPSSYSIYDYSFVVKELLNQLNTKKVNIVAHSFGGRIAIILASLHKELVEKIVLIDSAGIKPRFSLITYLKIKFYKFCKFLVKLKLIKKQHLKKFGSSDYKKLSEKQKQVFNRIIKEDLTKLLCKIEAPTLLIWGKKDKDTPLYMAKKIKTYVKDCGLIAFSKAGHYSFLEEPQKVQKILETFFKKENL